MSTLSIIIPCYNCEGTLADAVASIYRQAAPIPFDVTMVDDGSTDATPDVMSRLASQYPNVRLVRHPVNRGGGAARNTAVASSTGDVIFCLDSDDMMGPDFLQNLVGFWLEKRCDGVGIGRSIKFRGTNLSDVAYITEFDDAGEPVRFERLFDSSACSLYSTFLVTRKAFDYVGGYPTAHGFDTQGMAFRFLCNGLTAYTCPDAVYYHRVEYRQSYYVREDRAGRIHWNMFKVLCEFLYLFTDSAKATMLEYDYFGSTRTRGLLDELREANGQASVYREGFRELARLGRDGVAARLKESADRYDKYWLGTYHLSKGSYSAALDAYAGALKSGFAHRIIYGELLEAALRVSGNTSPTKLSTGNLTYFIGYPGRLAESSAPRQPAYQRFENWLMRRAGTRPLGEMLKRVRLALRRKPRQVGVGS